MIVYTIPLYAYCFGRAITMYNITIGLEPLTIFLIASILQLDYHYTLYAKKGYSQQL